MPKHDIGFEVTDEEKKLLEELETKLGHKWKKHNGHILFKSLGNKCVGPTCEICGYQFCLMCELPPKFRACKGLADQPSDEVQEPKREAHPIPLMPLHMLPIYSDRPVDQPRAQ